MDAKSDLRRSEYEYKHHDCDGGSEPGPTTKVAPVAADPAAALLNQLLGDTVGRFFSGSLVWEAGSPAVSSPRSASISSATSTTTPTTGLCSSSSSPAASPATAHTSTSSSPAPEMASAPTLSSSRSAPSVGHSSPLSRSSPPPPSPPVTSVQRSAPSTLPSRRRKLVQSCKQLKAQVQALKAQQKAAPDRKTLEATIAQLHGEYRRAKRFIRDDAATSIEAVARGFLQRTSWRGNSDQLPCGRAQRLAHKQARRAQSSPPAVVVHLANSPEVGNGVAGTSIGTAPSKGADAVGGASAVQSRLEQLKAAKRHLKDQLKSFDMKFLRQHQRLPAKADKEAIRPLYEKYNDVKTLMALLEHLANERGASTSAAHGGSASTSPSAQGMDSGDVAARGLRLFTDIGKGGNSAAPRSQPQSPSRCRSPGQRKAALEQRLLNFTRDYQLNNGCKPRSVMELPFAAARDYADFKELKLQMKQSLGSPAQGKENN